MDLDHQPAITRARYNRIAALNDALARSKQLLNSLLLN